MNKKLFSEKQVDISALLAGPIPPGILIFKNYLRLGKEKAAYFSLATTLVFTVIFFYMLLQIPDAILDKIPNFVFTAFYGLLVFLFFRKFMVDDVQKAFDCGFEKASNWSVTGLTIIGFVLNLAIIFGLSLNQPFYEGEKLLYNGNEIYYDSDRTSKNEVDKLVGKLIDVDFFGPDYGNIARLESSQEKYTITLVVDEQFWTDHQLMSTLTSMKWMLEVELGKPADLKLEHVSLSGISKYKTLQ